MSDETLSDETLSDEPKKAAATSKLSAAALDDLLARHGASALPWIVLLAATVGGLWHGPAFAVLALAAGALIAAIALLWTSLRAAFGDTQLTVEDAYGLGAPSAEEEQKRAVLRAIKDLEFERGVGKLADEDYEELMARYRAEAKRLLRSIDEKASPERKRVEGLVTDRLLVAGIEPTDEEDEREDERDGEDFEQDSEDEREDAGETACGSCDTRNVADAVFCKNCGAKFGEEAEA
ncbi:MAG: hypothetical protein VB934_03745 [Polyangiaceae bacterium]